MVKTFMHVGINPGNVDQTESWLGRPLDGIVMFGGLTGWEDWQSSLGFLAKRFNGASEDVVWSVPLIPYNGATLEAAANGDYNAKYLALAKQFLANDPEDDQIYIRLGWEFNGSWMPYSAIGRPQSYIDAFHNFVDAFRSVSDKFRFEWNVNIGDMGMNPEDAYPGDSYVDVIGIDFYYETEFNGFDSVAAWNYFVTQPYGLQWHADFAAAHNKPAAAAEWGVNNESGAAFLALATQWFEDHDFLYQSYWNSNSAFVGKLSDGQYPSAAAAFLAAYRGTHPSGPIDLPSLEQRHGTGADDLFIVDTGAVIVVELPNGGSDAVHSSVNFALPDNVENLVLTGNGNLFGTGNNAANVITGNGGANALSGLGGADTIFGGDGDDTLNGGSGSDHMEGGSGNDVYIVDNAGDVVVEDADSGFDRVESSLSSTLGKNFEALTLIGGAAINGTGNTVDNLIKGNGAANRLTGLDGNDTLSGGAGADTMVGGLGDDVYAVDNAADKIIEENVVSAGKDTVQSSISFSLADGLENLVLTYKNDIGGVGNASDNSIVGNEGKNALYGLAGNDSLKGGGGDDKLEGGEGADTLAGGFGVDTLLGGNGDDVYQVDDTLDLIVEYSGGGAGGIDWVESTASFTLGANLENLTLTGMIEIAGTGNALANRITGNAVHNVLDGRAGADQLIGGGGDDLYIVDNSDDAIVEQAGQGIDSVEASSSYVLSANVEHLTLKGTGAIDGSGNAVANELTGNDSDNKLYGFDQNDTIYGAAGNDYIDGGNGDDAWLSGDAGNDTIRGGEGRDQIVGAAGNDVISGDAGDDIWLAGDAGDDEVSGGQGDDLLSGGDGKDTLSGDAGSDQIYGELGDDSVAGGDGDDGWLSGGLGNDTIDGGAGADMMVGGDGDDLYLVDSQFDSVAEQLGEGNDVVRASASFVLASNLEQLILTGTGKLSGTGNAGSNYIAGNSADNYLDGSGGADTIDGNEGSDTLNGGGGADQMSGGKGDDTYIVDHLEDKVVEALGEGNDRINASISLVLIDNVERLFLTGAGDLNGTGNSAWNYLSGNDGANRLEGLDGGDYLVGKGGNDTLDGGNGPDTLEGGGGNDSYIVNDIGDVVIEWSSSGDDQVQSVVSYTLGKDVEDLKLMGAGNIAGTGNSAANLIEGNSGNNTLRGLAGNDTLDGGKGADKLYGGDGSDLFAFRAGEAAGDSILDFTAATANQVGDKLEFHGYGSGVQVVIAADSLSLAYVGGIDVITLNTAGLHLSDILFA